MATSGTYNFSLDIDSVCLDAWDLVGGQPILGYDGRMARRALNLLLIEWDNREIPLFTVPSTPVVLDLTEGDQEYTLPANYIDVIEGVLRTTSQLDVDLGMQRLGLKDWLLIPNKTQQGRPTQWMTNRQKDAIVLNVWQIPNADDTYQFVYWPFSKIQDVTNATQDPDVPTRFLPALTTGLAYYLGKRRQGVTFDKIMNLKADYEEQLKWAMEEDRERASMVIVPKVRRLGG